MSNITYLEATASLKKGAGKLKGIFVSAASSTPTITVYDTETTGTDVTVLGVFTPVAATNYNFYDGLNTENGIYVVISGTVKATFYYE
jgi:DNA polymerase III epsilon subunit-like protein